MAVSSEWWWCWWWRCWWWLWCRGRGAEKRTGTRGESRWRVFVRSGKKDWRAGKDGLARTHADNYQRTAGTVASGGTKGRIDQSTRRVLPPPPLPPQLSLRPARWTWLYIGMFTQRDNNIIMIMLLQRNYRVATGHRYLCQFVASRLLTSMWRTMTTMKSTSE